MTASPLSDPQSHINMMAEKSNDPDVELLWRHIEELENDNALLKMQCEIKDLERQLQGANINPSSQTERRHLRFKTELPSEMTSTPKPRVTFTDTYRQAKYTEDPSRTDRSREYLSRAGQSREDTSRVDPSRADRSRVDLSRADQSTIDPPKVGLSTVDQSRLDEPRENHVATNAHQQSTKARSAMVKAATYDGTSSWLDFKAHFETCAEINGWSYTDKGLYLAVSLRGQAQGVFGNLSSNSKDYDSLTKALEDRFAPPNQTELYRVQLRERRQKASETLSELGQDIRRLTNLAYPSAPADLKETLAKEQFVDSLISVNMRLRIKQARPVSLNDAVRHAVELEAFHRAEKAKLQNQGIIGSAELMSENTTPDKPDETILLKLQASIDRLEEKFNAIQQNKTEYSKRYEQQKSTRTCYKCGSKFHLQANCPKVRSQNRRSRNQAPEKQHNDNKKKEPVSSKANSIGSGLMLPVQIGDQSLNCLVDTGATLTVLSSRVWDASPQSKQGMLTEYNRTLIAASGTPLEVRGRTRIMISINGDDYETDVVVANVENDLMMGLDFLERYECSVDVAKRTLYVQGKAKGLNCEGSIGCYRISIANDVTIPARSEIVVNGQVPNMLKSSSLYLVEPSERMLQSGKGLLARSLVHGNTSVPVRLLNVSEEDQVLHKGTQIGQLSPVDESRCRSFVPKSNPMPAHLTDLYERTVEGMSPKQCEEVMKLLIKYSSVFSETDEDLGRTGIVRHKIDTGDAHPIKQPLRRPPVHMNPEIDKQIDDMLSKKVIQPSKSPWSSGIVLVTKKDGSKRFCVDYRKLNDVTVKDSYPLPRIDDSLEQLAGAQWFSCIDLNAGYWQVELEEADRPKTAFNSRRGLFEFKVMPFGLCNAPATFERLMETVLAGLNWQVCLIYLDDVIVHGRTFEDMISNLDKVFGRLQEAGLKLKPRKCQLFCKEVSYLGHIVTSEGVKTDPQKTQTVRDWIEPKNVTEVRSFLGLCSYYRRFICGFATVAKPLHRLTEKGIKFEWTNECQQAFEQLKQSLCKDPILAHPDFTKEFILDTDASDFGIGAVLSQVQDGQERVIAYASKSLTKSERRYCVTRKELYALVHFVKYFRHYLYGKQFTVRTDHGSLRWLMRFKNPEGQLARWLEVLSSYDMKIQHRPGRRHGNADALSRKPCKQCGLTDQQSAEGQQVNQVDVQSINDCTNLKEAQEKDQDLSKLRQWLEEGERPPRKTVGCESFFLKALLCQWDRLEIREGIIVRRWEVPGTSIVNWQGIVPMSNRREVLKASHDIKASGHLGVTKTLSRIRLGYYWPGMQNDVKSYISGCEACTKRKDPTKTKRAPMEIVRSGFPMERIAIDILGDFPQTERGNRYILVIGDYFTKWMECHAMPNMEARTVATTLIEQVISRFGVPRRIHSDQGRQFESQLFAEMCRMLQIEKTRTTPYHAQSDGMVERFNKTLVAMLSAFVNEHHTDWDEHLQMVMMAYRSAEHETTGFTPNLCMLGRETNCPLDLMYEMPPAIKQVPLNQWIWELQERIELAHKIVRENTGEAMKRQKHYHDSKLSFETFTVGEKVYVFFPVKKVGCSSKLTSYWRGPYEVKERVSDVLYKVMCGRSGYPQLIHCDRIRKCKAQTLTGEEFAEQLPEPELEVEGPYTPDSEVNFRHSRRERRKPEWLNDYVLSLCSNTEMPKTKITERTAKFLCANCKETLTSPEAYTHHIDICVMGYVGCDICQKTFSTRKYYLQHVKRVHPGKNEESKSSNSKENTQDCEESDWQDESDYEISGGEERVEEIEKEDELLAGRVLCKKTAPLPVAAPKRKMPTTSVVAAQDKQKPSCSSLGEPSAVEKPASREEPVPKVAKVLKEVRVTCRNNTEGRQKRRDILVEEVGGEELYSSRVSCRKLGAQKFNLGEIVGEGSIDMQDVDVVMNEEGQFLLEIKYS